EIQALVSPEVSEAFSLRSENYLRALESEGELLAQLKLGDNWDQTFKSFTDSYLKSAAGSAADIEEALVAKKVIEQQAEEWRVIRERYKRQVRSSEIRLQDIFGVMIAISEESARSFRRQIESREADNGLGGNGPVEKGHDSGLDGPEFPFAGYKGQGVMPGHAMLALMAKKEKLAVQAVAGITHLQGEINKFGLPQGNLGQNQDETGRLGQGQRPPAMEGAREGNTAMNTRQSMGPANGNRKGTDHKTLDVMVKVNGKLIKRPEPRPESALPAHPFHNDDDQDHKASQPSLLCRKAELDL
ncbi:MAG: hypothetical protein LBU69_02010, partial [Deltaproteobacteria bacterium]|nr:hypothetical protein [Deltaproteobacteria bacterium]